MLYLFLATIIGSIAGQRINVNFQIILATIILLLILILYLNTREKRYIAVMLLLFSISLLNASIKNREVYRKNEPINGQFKICEKSNEKYIIKSLDNNIKLETYLKNSYKKGDVIKLTGQIKYFEKSMNEYGFNFRNFKKSNGISYKIKAISDRKVEDANYYYKIQNKFIEHIHKTLKKYLNEENYRLMVSIILADRTVLEVEEKNYFNNIGISHILALSGLHISIIMGFFEIMLGYCKVSKVKRRFFAIIFVLFYIISVGCPIGALRAFLMTSMVFAAFLLKKKYRSIDALFLSGIVNILINPFVYYSLAFIFSYLSVLSILLFYGRIRSKAKENSINSSLALTLSVNILIFPLNIYFFYNFSLLSFLANILILPIISIAIILSFIIIFISFTGYIIAPFINLILSILFGIILKLNDIKIFNISFDIFTLYHVLVYYFIIFIISKKESIKYILGKYQIAEKVLVMIIIYFLIVSIIALINTFNENKNMNVKFLYVGDGNCSIVRYGGKVYMIDTGGSNNEYKNPGEIYTLRYLKTHGISKIDGLFISNFSPENCDAYKLLKNHIKIENVYISHKSDCDYLEEMLNYSDVYLLNKGDTINLSDNVYFKRINDRYNGKDEKNRSMVLKLHFNGCDILYTGDITSEIEEDIYGQFNILKVANKGSRNSTTTEFLKKIRPEYAIISSEANSSHYPAIEVLKRLKDCGVKTLVTGWDGEIDIKIDKRMNEKWTIKTFIK